MEGYRWKAAVVTLSDKGFAGEREDKSGPLICEILTEAGYDVQKTILLPDEKEEIKKCLCELCDEKRMDIIKEITKYKIEKGLPVLDQNREDSMLKKNLDKIKNEEYKKYYKDVLDGYLKASKKMQEEIIKINKTIS